MTLKEKFDSLVPIEFGGMQEPLLTECEQIADEFAIGFAVFLDKNKKEHKGLFLEEILEIYKETL